MARFGRDRLLGSVEVDETYVGGMEHGVRGCGAETKFMVVIAIEFLSPKGIGRVCMQRIDDVSSTSLIPSSCSPELNPDKRLNGELKQAIETKVPCQTKAKLRQAATNHMTAIEKNPERIKSFLEDPIIAYAA
jgi:hypothetical protein